MPAGSVPAVTAVWILLAVAGVAAVADWTAVARSARRLELAAKPMVVVALTAAAAAIPAAHTHLVDRRWWFVAALGCCLVGDVLLMLRRSLFVGGLAAFLVAHILFVVGLLRPPAPPAVPPFSFSVLGLAVAAIAVVMAEVVPAAVVVRALRAGGRGSLVPPVLAYIAAIGTLVVVATNVGIVLAAVGAVSFLASDTLLALDRFVRPLRQSRVAVHVSYHLALVLLVLSLLR
jgi:uncharacterized membrane protein YhhN